MQFMHMKRRKAISELLGSLIMVAITLIAGAAAFGFVNGQVGSAANQIGNSVGGNVNFLNEKETIVMVYFGSSSSVTVWVFNNGKTDLYLSNIIVNGTINTSGSNTKQTVVFGSSSIKLYNSAGNLVCTVSTGLSSYQNPTLSATDIKQSGSSQLQSFTLTLPAGVSGCPSPFSFVSNSGLNLFSIVVTGQYGSTTSTIKGY